MSWAMSRAGSRVAAWVQASRPLAQVNIAMPLLVGQALAFAQHDRFSWTVFALLHVFGVLDQLFIVYANDYADAESDRLNETYTPFSGGSRVVPEGKLTPHSLRLAAWLMAAAMLGLCAWFAFFEQRPWVLAGGALAIALMWAYSFAPLRLSYRGHGEILQGLGLGVVLPVVGYYGQAGSFAGLDPLALLPLFLLGYAGNLNTSLPDFPGDVASQKRSYTVRLGQFRARRHTLELLAIAACLTPLVVPPLPWPYVLAIVLGPIAVLATNLPLLGSADAQQRDECRRFVFVNGAALNLALLGWTLAGFLAR